MAKHIDTKTVVFTEHNDFEGNLISEDNQVYLGCQGLLLIMKTERTCRKHPGEYYLSFYPSESNKEQRHFDTPKGDLIIEGNRVFLNAVEHPYVFEIGELSDEIVDRISSHFFFGVRSMVF